MGVPLSWRSPRKSWWVPQGFWGSRGVLSHPAPRRRGRRGCGGAAGPGAAPGRAAPAAPGTARGEPPHSRSPTSPRGLRERGGKSLRKGVVRCTLYPAPPKEPHTPPAPLHPVGKQGQNCSRTGFGVFSPTPPKQPHTALVLLHPTGKGRQNPIGRRFWGHPPPPHPLYPVDREIGDNRSVKKGHLGCLSFPPKMPGPPSCSHTPTSLHEPWVKPPWKRFWGSRHSHMGRS